MDEPSPLPCPRCGIALVAAVGELHEDACPRCLGRFLPAKATEELLGGHLGIDAAMLRELATHFAGAPTRCSGCGRPMRALTLRGVPVDVCFACGGLWLDAWELSRLSGGRYEEVPPAPPEEPLPLVASTAIADPGPRFALFQADQQPPDENRLASVFRDFFGLTLLDVRQLLSEASGVLATGLEGGRAEALRARLAREGVGSAVVPEAWLRVPPTRGLQRLELRSDSVIVVDATGQGTQHAWADLQVICAGTVPQQTVSVVEEPPPHNSSEGFSQFIPTQHRVQETDLLVVDLLLARPRARWRATPTTMSFMNLDVPRGDRRARLQAMVPLLAQRAPTVALGAGAVALRANARRAPRYRRPQSLEREMAWLLWRHHGPGATTR